MKPVLNGASWFLSCLGVALLTFSVLIVPPAPLRGDGGSVDCRGHVCNNGNCKVLTPGQCVGQNTDCRATSGCVGCICAGAIINQVFVCDCMNG